MTTVPAFFLIPCAGLLALTAAQTLAPGEDPASPQAASLASTVTWSDYDGDGRLDALSLSPEGRLRLLASRGSGFEDVSESAGLAALDSVSLALWGDYDGDGRADLFVGRSHGASQLLRSEGGSFIDMAAGAGLVIDEPVQAAHWLDEDGDGRIDLHVVTGASNQVWRGLEGGFFEAVALPLEVPLGMPGVAGGALAAPADVGPASGDPAGGNASAGSLTGRPAGADGAGAPSSGGGPRPLVVRPETPGGSAPLLAFPTGCTNSIRDQANPGSCLQASSTAVLGKLYPLSSKLFVEEATGEVGIGTTSPSYRLHVNGKVVSGSSNFASGTNAAMSGGEGNLANGDWSAVGGGRINWANSDYSTISGGRSNSANGRYAAIGGGKSNVVTAGAADFNTIGGGSSNEVGGSYSISNTIGGGSSNYAGGYYAARNTVGGGSGNDAFGDYASNNTVSGGTGNEAGGLFASSNTVGGGSGNDAGGSYVSFATVGGGQNNGAIGGHATIPGGSSNAAAGTYSFAAGRRAKANHAGSFVWGDGQDLDKPSSAADEFNVYAEGGLRVFAAGVATPSMVVDAAGSVGIGTSTPADALHVEGIIRSAGASGGQVSSYNPNNQNASVTLSWLADVARIRVGGSGAGGQGGLDIQTQNDTSLMRLLHNGNVGIGTTTPAFDLEVNGTAAKPGGGSWSVSSDARLKKDVEDLEGALATLLALRGVSFEYIDPKAIGELEGRRIGFLAQEVERVLPDWVAEKENGTKYLTIRGFEALAVEALRELERRNQELAEDGAAKDARIAELEAQSRAQETHGRELGARVERLEAVQLELEDLKVRLAALER